MAKNEQRSQEAFILKGENGTEGSGEHFLFEHSGTEGLGRVETGTAGRQPGFRDLLTGAGLGCYGAILPAARFHQHLLPQFLSCGQQN